ncbi:general substrate transporter [Aspergillus insuetus]
MQRERPKQPSRRTKPPWEAHTAGALYCVRKSTPASGSSGAGYNARYPRWLVGRPLLWMTSLFGSLGDALFGFDQGIMAGLLVNSTWIKRFLATKGGADGTTDGVDPSLTGIIVACLQVAAAVAALFSGALADKVGRKRCVRAGGFLYLVTAIMQCLAPSLGVFIAGRTLQGFAVGMLSMTVPIIQAEIARPHRRGLLVGVQYTLLIGSFMLSCWINYGAYFLIPNDESWRVPFYVQMFLASILVFMSFYLPETPRWLARYGFMAECEQTLADLHGAGNIDDADVQLVLTEIKQAAAYESSLEKVTWGEMFGRYRKRTIMAITAQMFAQLNGINVISFYLPSTLSRAGYTTDEALLYTAANAVIYTASTIPTWWLADRWGRKPLLIYGGCLMAIFLAMMCVFTEAKTFSLQSQAHGIFAFVVLYNAAYGGTWGPMPWLLPAEIFPMRARSIGVALSTCSNWTFNFIIGMSSPDAFDGLGGYYYVIILGFCLFSVGLVKLYYVETSKHTLEELAIAFGDRAFEDDDDAVMSSAGRPGTGGEMHI